MGRYVTLTSNSGQGRPDGAVLRPITDDSVKEFTAEHIELGEAATLKLTVPSRSDGYLFVLAGEIELACADESSVCGLHTFVGLPEGSEISLANRSGAKAGLLYLHTQGDARGGVLQGLGGVAITPLASAPSVYVADQKKNRTYFVSKEAARSERAHVMVVGYEKQTVTPMHHHPNAESIFIMLSGSIRFSIDGDDVVLNPGQAAFFASNDRHALCCAEGVEAASFLEFHIPASFSTVK